MAILLRLLGAFLLLAATFNPTQWNYVKWSIASGNTQLPLTLFLGLLLLAGYLIYVLATLRAIGTFGVLLLAAIAGSLLWLLNSWGLLSLRNPNSNTWIGLIILSFILAIGLSWSHLRQKLTGQATVDEINH